jgi:hypothetical protein
MVELFADFGAKAQPRILPAETCSRVVPWDDPSQARTIALKLPSHPTRLLPNAIGAVPDEKTFDGIGEITGGVTNIRCRSGRFGRSLVRVATTQPAPFVDT